MIKSRTLPKVQQNRVEHRKRPTPALAIELNSLWRKATESWFTLAFKCAEAAKQLSKGEIDELKEQLDFSGPTFSKLVTIGNDEKFKDPELKKVTLEWGYSKLYELKDLSADQLREGINSGQINAKTTRAALADYFEGTKIQKVAGSGGPKVDPLTTPLKCPPRFYAAIALKEGCLQKDLDALHKALEELSTSAFDIVLAVDDDLKAKNKWYEKSNKKLLALCEKAIKRHLTQRFRKEKQKNETRSAFLKRVGFQSQDWELHDHDGDEQLKNTLDNFGLGSEFESLRSQSLEDMPEGKFNPPASLINDSSSVDLDEQRGFLNRRRRQIDTAGFKY
jgi:hypothetical protein